MPSIIPRLKYELSSGHIQKHAFAQYCKRGDSSGIIWQCIEQLLHVRLLNRLHSPMFRTSLFIFIDNFIVSFVIADVNTCKIINLLEKYHDYSVFHIILIFIGSWNYPYLYFVFFTGLAFILITYAQGVGKPLYLLRISILQIAFG